MKAYEVSFLLVLNVFLCIEEFTKHVADILF